MYTESHNPYKVICTRADVASFNRNWPCSTLRDRSYWFEFDPCNGDLIDTDCPEHDDGPAALAISQDARAWLDDNAPGWCAL